MGRNAHEIFGKSIVVKIYELQYRDTDLGMDQEISEIEHKFLKCNFSVNLI